MCEKSVSACVYELSLAEMNRNTFLISRKDTSIGLANMCRVASKINHKKESGNSIHRSENRFYFNFNDVYRTEIALRHIHDLL